MSKYQITITPNDYGDWGWRVTRIEGNMITRVDGDMEATEALARRKAEHHARVDAEAQASIPKAYSYDYTPGCGDCTRMGGREPCRGFHIDGKTYNPPS